MSHGSCDPDSDGMTRIQDTAAILGHEKFEGGPVRLESVGGHRAVGNDGASCVHDGGFEEVDTRLDGVIEGVRKAQ